ncbi:MAG TPA: sigma-70 family RNA polymerase sigma factor [Gemmataceae bacterium]|nr:sigma-70 family RNA polymerase sigma factor [Gemmataceae bacterium]
MHEATGQPDSTDRTGELLKKARAGSRTALGQLLESCRAYLLLVANDNVDADLRSKGGASDLVQQTFLEAQQDFQQFDGQTQGELLNWLRGILRHNLADFRRHYRDRGARQVSQEQPLSDVELSQLRDRLRADTPLPEDKAAAAEDAGVVRRAISLLPANHRQVVEWRNYEGLPFEAIGKRLNRSAEAARKLWVRAIDQLSTMLEDPNRADS